MGTRDRRNESTSSPHRPPPPLSDYHTSASQSEESGIEERQSKGDQREHGRSTQRENGRVGKSHAWDQDARILSLPSPRADRTIIEFVAEF